MSSVIPKVLFHVGKRTVFEDGTIIPRVRGGSVGQGDTGASSTGDPQAAVVAAMSGAQSGGQGQAPEGQVQPGASKSGGNAFLDGILSEIDPAHRPIVEPYIGKWNAGVTRRFQELHGELAPYKELGDPDTLQQAMSLYSMIDSDPERVLELLQEAIGQGTQPQGPGTPQALEGEVGGTPSELPPEWAQKFEQYETVLEHMAERFLQQETAQSEEQEDAQLDQYIGQLKAEFGEFNEKYVLAEMMAGNDPAEAIRGYHASIQEEVNRRSRMPSLGPTLSGGGAVAQEGKSVAEASSKETKNLVANLLAASQNT